MSQTISSSSKLRAHTLLNDQKVKNVLKRMTHTPLVIDVGAGIRPAAVWPVERHIVIEPSETYLAILRHEAPTLVHAQAWELHHGTALEVLPKMPREATVLLLDVIEHMERDEGLKVLEIAEQFAQALLYTPAGFMGQEFDNWGLGQHEWQKHRSGWVPGDFPRWTVSHVGRGLLCFRL